MEARQANLLSLLKRNEIQFTVPIYQRTYNWTQKECRQLWSDILRTSQREDITHFVGSVVYIQDGHQTATSVAKYLVIDGQQRLTTLSLLLAALGKAIEENPDKPSKITRQRIRNICLVNPEASNDSRYKLILTQRDRNTFISLIEDRELPSDVSQRIVANYRFFQDCIVTSGLGYDEIFDAIGRLITVDVALERGRDNPQLIFESLNSTGLDLTQADLIRNYLLMDLKPEIQQDLYQNYWYKMEQSFGNDYSLSFDRFMRDYLTVKNNGKIPNINQIYSDFKIYAQFVMNNGAKIEDIVEDIYRYAKYFVRVTFLREDDEELKSAFIDLKELKVEVATPFLMEMYADYQQDMCLSRNDFLSALRLVESYVFRRAVCGIPTNSLNKTFATLSRDIDKSNYLTSIQNILMRLDGYKRFPRNAEFVREFISKDVYNSRLISYILRRLENSQRQKEPIEVRNYTIEHVMPQNTNLSSEWQEALGADWKRIQEQYLHTIGNLTLTGYNSEMSDRSFHEKRDMEKGFAFSPLYINQSLRYLETWNETQILARAETLSQLALGIWDIPAEPYQPDGNRTQSDEELNEEYQYNLQGDMLFLFESLNDEIMALDTSVRREFKKLYIAYKTSTNFVDITPQKKRLLLTINMEFSEIDDPQGKCSDVSSKGHWGNGDIETALTSVDDIEYAMYLIRQSFEKHTEGMF